jgi:hypothetical protein
MNQAWKKSDKCEIYPQDSLVAPWGCGLAQILCLSSQSQFLEALQASLNMKSQLRFEEGQNDRLHATETEAKLVS